jgi:hypothetical protein
MSRFGIGIHGASARTSILDRFLHHAEVIRLQGKSHRMYNRRKLLSRQVEETLTRKTE